jgi:hypothetical protein
MFAGATQRRRVTQTRLLGDAQAWKRFSGQIVATKLLRTSSLTTLRRRSQRTLVAGMARRDLTAWFVSG